MSLIAAAHAAGFPRSCSDATGRLLAVLASRATAAAELGTGAGVGAAWILSGLPGAGRLETVESDADLAATARGVLSADPRVTVHHGDWRSLRGPYDLLFVDVADAKDDPDAVIATLAPDGVALLDDLTPNRPGPDSVRDAWLRHPSLTATELQLSPTESAILAAVRSAHRTANSLQPLG